MLIELTGVSKVSDVALKNLASEEIVTQISNLFNEYLNNDVEDEDAPPISDANPDQQQLNNCGGDFGMEEEAKMTSVSLAMSLGFNTGRPFMFNTFRHRSGITPWEDHKIFAISDDDPVPSFLSRIFLHWHQYGGVHSITRSIFTPCPCQYPHHTLGVLIGDEVGLGKTAQAITFISFLNEAIFRQKTNRKPAKVLREFNFITIRLFIRY